MADKIHDILKMWFGRLSSADLPTTDRVNSWFGNDVSLKTQLVAQFENEFNAASSGQLGEWEQTPRGRLALILLFDQYPRCAFMHTAKVYDYDENACRLCLEGITKKMDMQLTLIERVFFYLPLVHSEKLMYQEQAEKLFSALLQLSMTEAKQLYELFFAYTHAHFGVIQQFGRFPQRNNILQRQSTQAELDFLAQA